MPQLLAATGAKTAINAKDKDGKTPLHHAVSYSKFGSFENVQLVNDLVGADAKYDIEDNEKKSPLFYALMQQSGTIANAFRQLSAQIPNSLKDKAQKE